MPPAGTRQDGVLALEKARVGQAAVRLHEHQPGVADLAGDLVDIAAQDRRQIRVDHGGVAAAHQFHQRADLVRGRDLGEAQLAGDLGDPPLVVGVAIAVHEYDRGRTDAVVIGRPQLCPRRVLVQGRQHLALGGEALVDLGDAFVQQFGQDNVALEQLGPVLIGDAQGVCEARGDDEDRPVALALEERIGRHGRAHLDRFDAVAGDGAAGRNAQDLADALQGGVVVALGIFRQQLVRQHGAVGPLGDHVRERAAPVDPELPMILLRLGHRYASPRSARSGLGQLLVRVKDCREDGSAGRRTPRSRQVRHTRTADTTVCLVRR